MRMYRSALVRRERTKRHWSDRMGQVFLSVLALFGVLVPLQPQLALADQCTPSGNVGACSGCQQCTVTDEFGNVCNTSIVCTGPGWPNCINQTPSNQICTPGTSSDTTSCNATGVQSCTYTCSADGTSWNSPVCVNVGNGGNFQQTFCDFGAGCPDGSNGLIAGKPTTIAQECTQNGVIQSVTAGACGDGGCLRQAVCRPGQPCPRCKPGDTNPECNYCTPGSTRQCGGTTQVCPDSGQFPPCPKCKPGDKFICPDGKVSQCVNGQYETCTECKPGESVYCSNGGTLRCTPDGKVPVCPSGCDVNGTCPKVCNQLPECHPVGVGWACSWNGTPVVSVPTPCPQVQRTPWPRGLVGVPMRFAIVNTSDVPGASNSVSVVPPTCDSRIIIGYRGTLSWMVESLDNAQWTMDERPWNIGQTSNNIISPVDGRPVSQSMLNGDLTIRNTRQGRAVTHIYETSSYDKPANGPGYPNLSVRQPAYQVGLHTRWTLVGNFQYQQRETVTNCYDNSSPPSRVTCPPPDDWCNAHPGDSSCRPDIHIRVTEVISPWHPGPAIHVGGIEVVGAVTPQDAAKGSTCDTIPTPIIQSQSVLVDPAR